MNNFSINLSLDLCVYTEQDTIDKRKEIIDFLETYTEDCLKPLIEKIKSTEQGVDKIEISLHSWDTNNWCRIYDGAIEDFFYVLSEKTGVSLSINIRVMNKELYRFVKIDNDLDTGIDMYVRDLFKYDALLNFEGVDSLTCAKEILSQFKSYSKIEEYYERNECMDELETDPSNEEEKSACQKIINKHIDIDKWCLND